MGKSNKATKVCNLKAPSLPTSRINYNTSKKEILPTSCVRHNGIVFSNQYFQCECVDTKDFNDCFINIRDYAQWITFFFNRLSSFCTMTVDELRKAGKSARFHAVSGKELEKLKRILLNKNLDIQRIFSQEESDSYYELSFGTGNGRMFGYLIEDKYYILLLDPNHLLYADTSQGAKNDLLYKKYNPWKELNCKDLIR